MATSSIFTNFTITDEKSAERFADTLDKAAQQPAWQPRLAVKAPVRDPEVLRNMMAKREKQHV
ncbi:MAG: hypothetical protein LUC98_11380 [Lachnospiraceae bacterium]|nr:hypothetical protein [Lachnospiraceae bacterium]